MSTQVVVRGGPTGLAQQIELGEHQLVADEPSSVGGADTGPDPYALLLASLGACTSMTVSLVARRKGWPLRGVTVRLRHERVHLEDCVDCDAGTPLLDRIEVVVALEGELDDTQRARLLDIAGRCPVHRTLTSPIRIDTSLAPAEV